MMRKIEEALMQFLNTRLKKPKDAFMGFYLLREEREKRMIAALGICFFLFADYWLCIFPVMRAFTRVMPELTTQRRLLDEIKSDKKNEDLMNQGRETTKQTLTDVEQGFIAPNELPSLLESLSKLAQESGVKILTVEPREIVRSRIMEPYARIPIRISAQAGTHELGRFLTQLEHHKTFFRVNSLKIIADPVNTKRHSVEIVLWAYRKG